MSSGTDGAVSRDRAVVRAGRVLAIQGVLHLMLTGWLSRMHIGGWSAGTAWFPRRGLSELSPAACAFWLTPVSFARPKILLAVLGDGAPIKRPDPPFTNMIHGVWAIALAARLAGRGLERAAEHPADAR